MGELTKLKGCDAHSTVLLSSVDETTFKKLGMQLTCEPKYEEDGRKYHKQTGKISYTIGKGGRAKGCTNRIKN